MAAWRGTYLPVGAAALRELRRMARDRLLVGALHELLAAVVGHHHEGDPRWVGRNVILRRAGRRDEDVVGEQAGEHALRPALGGLVAGADRVRPVALPTVLGDQDRVAAAGAAARHRVRGDRELRPRLAGWQREPA